jgi:hypothetical protein
VSAGIAVGAGAQRPLEGGLAYRHQDKRLAPLYVGLYPAPAALGRCLGLLPHALGDVPRSNGVPHIPFTKSLSHRFTLCVSPVVVLVVVGACWRAAQQVDEGGFPPAGCQFWAVEVGCFVQCAGGASHLPKGFDGDCFMGGGAGPARTRLPCPRLGFVVEEGHSFSLRAVGDKVDELQVGVC